MNLAGLLQIQNLNTTPYVLQEFVMVPEFFALMPDVSGLVLVEMQDPVDDMARHVDHNLAILIAHYADMRLVRLSKHCKDRVGPTKHRQSGQGITCQHYERGTSYRNYDQGILQNRLLILQTFRTGQLVQRFCLSIFIFAASISSGPVISLCLTTATLSKRQ